MSKHFPIIPVPPSTDSLNPADLLDENEGAEKLSVAVQTLRNWRWRGEGPAYVKVGKRTVRYRRGDLDAFIEASTKQSCGSQKGGL